MPLTILVGVLVAGTVGVSDEVDVDTFVGVDKDVDVAVGSAR